MKTESNKLLNDKIDSWAEALTERLIEIRLIDVAKIKTSLKTHLKLGLIDCLNLQITNTEKTRKELILKLNKTKGFENKQKIRNALTELNLKLKSEKMLYAELDRDRQAKEMVLWMRKKHPESILSFYKMYNEKYTKHTK